MSLTRCWIILLCLPFVFTLVVVLSGNQYLFAVLDDTYLRGRLAPPITEANSYLTEQVRVVSTGRAQPWKSGKAYNQGSLPTALLKRIEGYGTGALLVIRNGELIHEQYFGEFDRNTRSNSNSVAKSFVSTLTGIALAEGYLKSLDQPVVDFVDGFDQGSRAKLTLRHLLTMSAATDFRENYDNPLAFPARAHYGKDLTRLLLDRFQVVGEPGLVHKYDSSNTALLGLVLQRALRKPLSEYMSEKLWQPLGAELPMLWSLDQKDGIEKAYCCLYATARDYARLGQLFLNAGRWGGKQLVPTDYVRAAWSAAPLLDNTGQPTERYGYSWWRMQHRGLQVNYAWGYQGQYIAAIPEKNLLVVRLGDGGGYTQNHYQQDFPVYLDAALSL